MLSTLYKLGASNGYRRPQYRRQQVLRKIYRSLSVTKDLHQVKLAERSALGASSGSLMETISAEWDGAKPFSQIPGPTRFRMIRGFMKGGEFHNVSLFEILRSFRGKYGEIFKMPGHFGQGPMILLFNPKDFERVHRTEGAWPVRPGGEALIHYRVNRKGGLFKETQGLAGSGKTWADFRKMVNPVLLKYQNVRLYLEPMMHVNNEFIQRIRDIRDPVTHEVPENFLNDINLMSLESVAVVALDKQLGLMRGATIPEESKLLFTSIQIFLSSFYDLGIKPTLFKYFPSPTYKRFERAMDHITDICSKYVNEVLERLESEEGGAAEGRSVLEKLLKIDRKIAIITALDLLQTGVDTTSTVFAATLLQLAKNPDKQSKLREEIMNAVASDNRFTIENMQNLPFLRACIKEAIRIWPTSPGHFRCAGKNIVLSGYRIPQGTRILTGFSQLLNEERYFPRSKEFLPERWIRGESKGLMAEDLSPFIYMPFGFGPRSCVGRRIVDLELELGVASMVRNFVIEFDYSIENAFGGQFMSHPAIPLKFKFTDL